ncbi:hypothetical protein [Methanofervidicoccus abyssi]|uniref:Uncharacterized protein n=1 Tax=Methanofervidicoccus abyssi TaxID=2082189 RepID=A0A401HRJ9_9EURY|nr:hypothetical protein [Methanofervidicoccus abyssi]GBF36761.1 hypothetical protein MHHB_P0991 [Methanofervidicoccus abyssi]
MNVKLDIVTFKDDEKIKEIDEFSKDLKRPYRMDNKIKILAYIFSILIVISALFNIVH